MRWPGRHQAGGVAEVDVLVEHAVDEQQLALELLDARRTEASR